MSWAGSGAGRKEFIMVDSVNTDRIVTQEFGINPGSARTVRRLPDVTRQLAARALAGEYGRSLQKADFALSDDFYMGMPTPNAVATEAIRLIGEKAPLRILPEERLAGAATLREAADHQIPVAGMGSVSHTTLGFEKALRVGYRGLRLEVQDRLTRPVSAEGRDFLESLLVVIEGATAWHRRHIQALELLVSESSGVEHATYREVLEALRTVPENPPATFREALQALWFLWDFQRLCGNWSGVGRFDKMLGPFLRRDLDAGRITLDDARNLIAHFWIKGCEWVRGGDQPRGSGDAQFYQNVILAGMDEAGHEVANEVTDLVLDVVEELHISDFPIAVRVSARTPERLLRRVAELQRLGGGIVAVYNEDLIIRTLEAFGYPPEEARNFTNDGCWEILIPGKTCFSYVPIDLLQVLQETLGLGSSTPVDPPAFVNFDALFAAFERRVARAVTGVVNGGFGARAPAPLVALLVEGCVERARGYYELGPLYSVISPHASGLPDVANSLLVIRRLVFEEKRLTLPALVEILRTDWSDQEALRRSVQSRFEFYGNDSAEADAMVQRVFNVFTDLVGRVRERFGILRPAGISTFGREMSQFLQHRFATASGHHRGEILAANFSPAPGTDCLGPTAVIRSYCSVDFGRLPCGTALDLKILPSSVSGEEGLGAMVGMIKAFVELGGVFMQIDVVDTALLRDAQAHPEKYPNLSVRVSGWSARFATLDSNWQELIIRRTQQELR